MKTIGFGTSKSTTLEFWTHQDQQSCDGTWFCGSKIAPGPAKLCWCRYSGSRASKPVLVHTEFKDAFLDTDKGYFGFKDAFWDTGKGYFAFCMHQHKYGDSRASKPVRVRALWHQGQQTCVGAHGIQSRFFGDGKTRFWSLGQTLNDLQSSVLLSTIATSDI